MGPLLDVRPEVAEALSAGRPVVALETTVFAHGLPAPRNLEAARRMAAALGEAGAIAAPIGLLDGKVRVGLGEAELERLASAGEVAKVSRRDLAAVLARGAAGATTVAGTLACAALAGIRVLATGGLGGVHRGTGSSLDVSADLVELARSPVAVVCAGAKSILDLAGTLELLESAGVPVVGYGTDEFPAFFARGSGLALAARVDGPEAAGALLRTHWSLGLGGAVVFANPIPEAAALDPGALEGWTAAALAEARAQGVRGPALTPFVLARLDALSGGRTVEANLALLEHNARVAGRIAAAQAARRRWRG